MAIPIRDMERFQHKEGEKMNTAEGTRLDLPIDAKIHAADTVCGRSVALILNPNKDEVTHVAVRLSGITNHKVIVPVKSISRSSEDEIWLDLDCEELSSMPEFVRTDFVEAPMPQEVAGGALLYWPFVIPEVKKFPVEVEMVPVDELAIHPGVDVISLEGKVGKVDEFLIDPQSDQISHIVMHEGHLWGKQDVLIPISHVSEIGEHFIRVELDKQQIEALPEIPVHRDGSWTSS
jgi:sporulation protein YlmC with PRC-barrel domain